MTNSNAVVNEGQKEPVTKDLIIGISQDLFSLYGYIGVSMRSIAEKLDITKPALYYHFKNKQELYFEVLTHSSKEFMQLLSQSANQKASVQKRYHDVITTYIDYSTNKKDMVHLMMQKVTKKDQEILNFISKVSDEILDLLEPLIKEVLKKNQKIKKVNSRFVTHLLVGVLNSFIISQSLSGRKKYNPKQVADQLVALTLNN